MNVLKSVRTALAAASLLLMAACPLFAAGKSLVQDGSVTYRLYTVQRGDSIWRVSEKELNDASRWNEIFVPEKMSFSSTTPDLIRPGQLLFLPVKQEQLGDGEGADALDITPTQTKDAGAQSQAQGPIKRIFVKEFKPESKSRAYDWVPIGLATTMSEELAQWPGLYVVDRNQPDAASKADAVISGSVAATHSETNIHAVLTSTDGTTVFAEARISGTVERLVDLSRLLLIKLLERKMDLSGDEQAQIMERKKTTAGALKNISKAMLLDEQGMGKGKEAKELYRHALESDPTNSTALEKLKENLSSADALAVLPLANVSGKQEHDWLGRGIAEALTTDLKKASGVNIVERIQIEKTMAELKLSSIGGLVDEKTVPKLGKMAGAAIVLIGSYQVDQANVRVDIRMVDVASGIVLLTETAKGELARLFEVETLLAEKIVAALNVQLSPEEKLQMSAGKPDIETFKKHILATSSLSVENKQSASTRVRSLAILQFDNASKTPEYDWLCAALPGSLTTDITAQARIPLVERMQIDRALEELKLASVGMVSADTAPQIGKFVGADALITGSFQVAEGQIRIDSMIIKVETGEILGSARVNGDASDVLSLQKKLADEMLITLGVRDTKAQKAQQAQQAQMKPVSESWAKITNFDAARERDIISSRAYRFEASVNNRTHLNDTLVNLKDLSQDEVLLVFNQWIPYIRGLKNAENGGTMVQEGGNAPYSGFLLPREYLERIIFLKDERDLCLKYWDDQVTSKLKK